MKTVFRKRWYLFVPLILLAFVAFGFITMWLWNSLMTEIFNLPAITFWQTVGLMVLSRLLLGGFGGHQGRHHRPDYRNHMNKKWENMTPEEREQFRDNIHSYRPSWLHCCPEKEKASEA